MGFGGPAAAQPVSLAAKTAPVPAGSLPCGSVHASLLGSRPPAGEQCSRRPVAAACRTLIAKRSCSSRRNGACLVMQAADHRLAPLCSRQESKQLVPGHSAISADGHQQKQLRDPACTASTGIEGRIPSQEGCNCCLSAAYRPGVVYLLFPTQSSGNMSLLIKTWAGLSFKSCAKQVSGLS